MTKPTRTPRVEREKRPLSSLRTWPRNIRQGDVGAIYVSIQRWGFNGALRVWQDPGAPDDEPATVIALKEVMQHRAARRFVGLNTHKDRAPVRRPDRRLCQHAPDLEWLLVPG